MVLVSRQPKELEAVLFRLESDLARADVSVQGGELQAWYIGGQNLLWERDPQWWDQSAPILFPIVGWANQGRINVDGRSRPIGVHGFAAQSQFTMLERTDTSITLVLASDERTFHIYPFSFRLLVSYKLKAASLSTRFAVENTDRRIMPYAIGFHPAFRWPLGGGNRADHAVIFAAPESSSIPVIAAGGLLSSETRRIPLRDRRLELTDELFASDALCFLNANSGAFRFSGLPQGPSIRLETSNFPHLALWSRSGAPFISMEAWTGHSDPVGFTGELIDKPSMRLLAPGATAHHGVDFFYRSTGCSA
jgi:galactose mutarotase-like enzyme